MELDQQRVKILYIGGYLRIGSTLLDRMLGQCEGFISVGELRRIWEESFAEDQPCGCGEPFSACGFWESVMEEAYGGSDRVDTGEIIKLKRRVDRMRHIPRLMSARKGPGYREALSEYADVLDGLYAAVREVSGSRVIIDSSKDPSYAYLLANLPGVDLNVVHLVRDSRAVAYSWLKKKIKHETRNGEGKVYMPRRGPAESAIGWMRANLLMEPLELCGVKNLMVRYEDLLADPRRTLGGILSMLEEEHDLPFLDGDAVELGVAHTLAGNPMRFQRGSVELRPDEEWRTGLSPADRGLVTAMTLPLLSKYGYLGGRAARPR